uniref:Uncharacterized protein n=1 Tax=Cucumis melo TaxID=3656 RepID=A0A9I9EL08_CUCME
MVGSQPKRLLESMKRMTTKIEVRRSTRYMVEPNPIQKHLTYMTTRKRQEQPPKDESKSHMPKHMTHHRGEKEI